MSEENSLAPYSGNGVPQEPPAQVGLWRIVQRAMATRWRWMILIALPASVVAAMVGYALAPVKYTSVASIKIESKPEALLGTAAELERLSDPNSFMQGQRILISDPASLRFVEQWARDGKSRASIPVSGRDRAAEIRVLQALFQRESGNDPVGVLDEGLVVETIKNTTIIQVRFTDEDPKVPAPVVNALVDVYMENRIPDAETEATQRTQDLRDLYNSVSRTRETLEAERESLLRDSPFGTAALAPLIADRVDRLEILRQDLADVQADIRRIKDSADWEGDAEPPDDALVEPTLAELEVSSPELIQLLAELVSRRADFDSLSRRYREGHSVYDRVAIEVRRLEDQLAARRAAARDVWRLRTGQTRTYGELKKREQKFSADITTVRGEVDRLNEMSVRIEQINRRISDSLDREREVGQMLAAREANARSVREGRISVSQWATPPTLPDSDKRLQISVVAGIGTAVAVFGVFLLWGQLAPCALSLAQFPDGETSERLIGPLPDLTEVPDRQEASAVVTNCVHRLRNTIETRRAAGDGYAIVVSSPLQGDGKTTVAMALASSYAASGRSVLLVDCDFIGRALSHQYRLLHAKGIREALRRRAFDHEVYPSGVEGLSILPNGVDSSFSAANLDKGTLRQLLRVLRDRYQIVIVDCGPMTASVEARPVTESCDGAVLTIRCGRSLRQLDTCIRMVREAGAEYLGLVLNYADYNECLDFGSISKMSADVSRALEDRTAQPPSHPVLEALGSQAPQFVAEAARSGDAVILVWVTHLAGVSEYRVLRSEAGEDRWDSVSGALRGDQRFVDADAGKLRSPRYIVQALSPAGIELARTPVIEPRA